jgi:hypothetical protein
MYQFSIVTKFGPEICILPNIADLSRKNLTKFLSLNKEWIQQITRDLTDRKHYVVNPQGFYLKNTKWVPVERECCDQCRRYLTNSKKQGNWFINHCRSKTHLLHLFYQNNKEIIAQEIQNRFKTEVHSDSLRDRIPLTLRKIWALITPSIKINTSFCILL